MILRELTALHEEAQTIVDEMERDGTATAYPQDYRKAVERAEFYIVAAMNYEALTKQMGDRLRP